MRIEIDGTFAIDRAYEGLVLQRYVPEHQAERDGKYHKKGDMVPGKWVDCCYPWDLAHALNIIKEDAVLLSTETVTDLSVAIKEWNRIEQSILEASDTLRGQLGLDSPTGLG